MPRACPPPRSTTAGTPVRCPPCSSWWTSSPNSCIPVRSSPTSSPQSDASAGPSASTCCSPVSAWRKAACEVWNPTSVTGSRCAPSPPPSPAHSSAPPQPTTCRPLPVPRSSPRPVEQVRCGSSRPTFRVPRCRRTGASSVNSGWSRRLPARPWTWWSTGSPGRTCARSGWIRCPPNYRPADCWGRRRTAATPRCASPSPWRTCPSTVNNVASTSTCVAGTGPSSAHRAPARPPCSAPSPSDSH